MKEVTALLDGPNNKLVEHNENKTILDYHYWYFVQLMCERNIYSSITEGKELRVGLGRIAFKV